MIGKAVHIQRAMTNQPTKSSVKAAASISSTKKLSLSTKSKTIKKVIKVV